jgi:hypothetical protein
VLFETLAAAAPAADRLRHTGDTIPFSTLERI